MSGTYGGLWMLGTVVLLGLVGIWAAAERARRRALTAPRVPAPPTAELDEEPPPESRIRVKRGRRPAHAALPDRSA